MSAAESVVASIQHYQRSIDKSHGNSARVLHCINKLYQLPVSVQHLQDTGVGKTINSLRKSDGEVGDAARALVFKWKQMVEEESEKEQQDSVNVRAHSSHNNNDDSENETPRERVDKPDKVSSERTARDGREQLNLDSNKTHKRKRESDTNLYKEKRSRSEQTDAFRNPSSASKGKVKSEDVCSDDDLHANRYKNGETNSDDDKGIVISQIKTERNYNEEYNAQSSEDDVNSTEQLAESSDKESWHRKEETSRYDKSSKKGKSSSHKHKSKSSSSSSDKLKHSSSSRSEHKDGKSSSNSRQKEDKSSLVSGSSGRKLENSVAECNEEKLKSKEKDKKDKHKDKLRSKDEKKSKDKREKEKEKKADAEEDGVDSFSGKSFGEALGMMFPPEKSRKKSSTVASSTSPSKKKPKSSSSTSSSESKPQPKDSINLSLELPQSASSLRLEQLEVDEDYGLPTLNPNYKPLPQPNFFNSPPKRYQNDEDELSNIMYSKVQRTKVFSGNKTGYTYVPSLFDLCTRVLQENIDALEYTGGVPFDLLKPVFERATPDQLFTLEHYNAYLIEDTDVFWEFHCKKDFRNKKREEMETWREMYMRCREERESKLKSLTLNIAASKAKAQPVRKTQLAYIEGTVKPPRNIAKKQIKFGTAHAAAAASSSSSSSSSASRQDSSGYSSSFTGRSATAPSCGPAVAVPTPRGAAGSNSHSSSCKPKPKAPLMQKALQLIKYNRFKR